MERKIGETFEYHNKKYKVVKSEFCSKCALFGEGCTSQAKAIRGECLKMLRSDRTSVIFVEYKEQNKTMERKINSTFEYKGKTYIVKPNIYCNNCAFLIIVM